MNSIHLFERGGAFPGRFQYPVIIPERALGKQQSAASSTLRPPQGFWTLPRHHVHRPRCPATSPETQVGRVIFLSASQRTFVFVSVPRRLNEDNNDPRPHLCAACPQHQANRLASSLCNTCPESHGVQGAPPRPEVRCPRDVLLQKEHSS